MKRMIYYYPAPIKETAQSASGIRPRKMLEAFRQVGYDVDLICGYTKERKEKMARVRENVKKGAVYDFAYGEDTTLPFAMNDPSHVPAHPLMDYAFWSWLKKNNIPFGCFYRDMFWRFPEFRKGLAFHKWAAPLPFHYLDVFMLRRWAKSIFFPSVQFANDLPLHIPDSMVHALPPGCDSKEVCETETPCVIWNSQNPLKLFYVGGMLPPAYNMTPLIDFAANTASHIELTICCREKEFQKAVAEGIYPNIASPRINIIHKSGAELDLYWKAADIFVVLREKTRYLKNTVPFKISEAIGWGVPIIISNGSVAADMVKENNFGWVVEPCVEDMHKVLLSVISAPEILKNKRQNILRQRAEFTWEARAKFVARTLLSCGGEC